jgi:hypothetical protein
MVVPHRVGRRGSGHDQFPGPDRAGCRRDALRPPAALRREPENAPGGAAAVVRRAAANPGRLDRRPPGADAAPTSGSGAITGRAPSARPVVTGIRTGTRCLGSAGVRPPGQPGLHGHRPAVVTDGRQAVGRRGPAEAAGKQRPQHLAIHLELPGRAGHQPSDPARRPWSRSDTAGTAGHRRIRQPAGLPTAVRRTQPQPTDRHPPTHPDGARVGSISGPDPPRPAAGRAAGGLLPCPRGHPAQGPAARDPAGHSRWRSCGSFATGCPCSRR